MLFPLKHFCVSIQAGIIEEMMEDTFEGLEDQDDLEEEAQEEVDKVLWELTAGKSMFNICTQQIFKYTYIY